MRDTSKRWILRNWRRSPIHRKKERSDILEKVSCCLMQLPVNDGHVFFASQTWKPGAVPLANSRVAFTLKVKLHRVCLQTCLWFMLLVWLPLLEWNSFLRWTREAAWKVRKAPKERAANPGLNIAQANNSGHSTAQANNCGYRIAQANNVHREISSSPCRTQLIQCTKQVPPP